MKINANTKPETTAVNSSPLKSSDNASSAGDFSAQLSKLFSAAHTNRNNSSDASSSHDNKHSKSFDQDTAAQTLPQQLASVVVPTPVMPQQTPVDQASQLRKPSVEILNAASNSSVSFSATVTTTTQTAVVSQNNAHDATQVATLPAPADNDSSLTDATDENSDNQLDATSALPSQNDNNVASTAQQPVSTIPAPAPATSSDAALLAAVQAKVPATTQAATNNAPVSDAHTQQPVEQTSPVAAAPAPAHRPEVKAETITPPSANASQTATSEALAKAAQVAVAPQTNNVPANTSVKTAPAKQTDKSINSTTFDRDASLQNSIESNNLSSTAPVTGNGLNVADNSAKQDSGSSADSDRRSKDDAIASVVATTVQAPAVQTTTMAAVHTVGAPASHQMQDQPASASAPSFSGSPATAGQLTDLDASAASEVKTVINTSKLVQTMGQSEMKVGLRSSEFGDISINTSATHNGMSTQISLDHAELAKSLASHIPDIQARLAGFGNHEVRITGGDQNTASNSTMSDTRSGSQGQQQDGNSRTYAAGNYGASNFFESALPTATLANSLQSVSYNGRLDIQA